VTKWLYIRFFTFFEWLHTFSRTLAQGMLPRQPLLGQNWQNRPTPTFIHRTGYGHCEMIRILQCRRTR